MGTVLDKNADPGCKTCFGMGEEHVYFVNRLKKLIIEEWIYCQTCYPTSDCHGFDKCCYESGVEDITAKDAHTLIEKEGYKMHVP